MHNIQKEDVEIFLKALINKYGEEFIKGWCSGIVDGIECYKCDETGIEFIPYEYLPKDLKEPDVVYYDEILNKL